MKKYYKINNINKDYKNNHQLKLYLNYNK